MLPGVLLAFPVGWLGARFGDKAIGLCGLAAMVVCSVLGAQATSFGHAALGRVICGIGAITLNVLLAEMTTDWFANREIATAMGYGRHARRAGADPDPGRRYWGAPAGPIMAMPQLLPAHERAAQLGIFFPIFSLASQPCRHGGAAPRSFRRCPAAPPGCGNGADRAILLLFRVRRRASERRQAPSARSIAGCSPPAPAPARW